MPHPDFIRITLAALLLASTTAVLAQGNAESVYSPLGPISRPWDPQAVTSWSSMVSTIITWPDGRLFTWISPGKHHDVDADLANEDIVQPAIGYWSSDGGKTWSDKKHLFDFPKGKGVYLDGVSLLDRDGVLHIFGLHYISSDWTDPVPEKQFCYLFYTRSADLGKTWTPVQQVDFGHTYTGQTNSVIQLRSGRILVPLSFYSSRQTGKFIATCVYTDDGGKTWHKSKSDVAVDSGHRDVESGACEPVCLEMNDGRVWMLVRTQTGYQYESWSSDGGDTWAEPTQSRFVDTNAPVMLLRLKDGRILLAWNDCTFGPYKPVRADRAVVHAAISADDGKTWRGYREIARCVRSDAISYPFMAQLPDGKVAIWLWFGGVMLPTLDPDWLLQAAVTDHFAKGLDEWSTIGTEGVAVTDHPDKPGSKVLRIRKMNPDLQAAAVRNFPFGVTGRMDLRLRIEPGFQGARLCLNDFYSIPATERLGRFSLRIAPDGTLYTVAGDGRDVVSEGVIEPGKWHDLTLIWDCTKKQCTVVLDKKRVAEAWQLLAPDLAEYPPNLADGQKVPDAEGICYLRIWSTAEATDEAGMMVESMKVHAKS